MRVHLLPALATVPPPGRPAKKSAGALGQPRGVECRPAQTVDGGEMAVGQNPGNPW